MGQMAPQRDNLKLVPSSGNNWTKKKPYQKNVPAQRGAKMQPGHVGAPAKTTRARNNKVYNNMSSFAPQQQPTAWQAPPVAAPLPSSSSMFDDHDPFATGVQYLSEHNYSNRDAFAAQPPMQIRIYPGQEPEYLGHQNSDREVYQQFYEA